MINLIIMALIFIGAIAILAFAAPRIKRWIKDRQRQENGKKTQLFNCSMTSRGGEPGSSNSADIYDCVEEPKDGER